MRFDRSDRDACNFPVACQRRRPPIEAACLASWTARPQSGAGGYNEAARLASLPFPSLRTAHRRAVRSLQSPCPPAEEVRPASDCNAARPGLVLQNSPRESQETKLRAVPKFCGGQPATIAARREGNGQRARRRHRFDDAPVRAIHRRDVRGRTAVARLREVNAVATCRPPRRRSTGQSYGRCGPIFDWLVPYRDLSIRPHD